MVCLSHPHRKAVMLRVCGVRRLWSSSGTATLPILGAEDALQRWRAAVPPKASSTILASYSSALGGITTDPSLMMIPLDDHGFHRGHCVFDTCALEEGRAFGLQMHLDRLLRSARQAQIIDDSIDASALREVLRSIVLQTFAAAGRRDQVFMRYWLTAGRGDFSISPSGCTPPEFYAVVHEDAEYPEDADHPPAGFSAAIVDVPLKTPLLATMKTNNYLINALVAMEAERLGVDLGLQLDDQGNVCETAVGAVAVVDGDGVLRSPPADQILASTTWARVRELAPTLVDQGVLSGCIADEALHVDALASCSEMFTMGGGWVEPIVEFNKRPVGTGKPGPIFNALDALVRADFLSTEHTDAVPFADRI
jgi:4-amino-4-deoxychorismate lyase